MAENDSTASNATHDEAELFEIQAQLDRVMSNKDDKTKKRIFNQVILKLTDALPDLPPETHTKVTDPAATNNHSNLLHAVDKLREAGCLAEFIQSISLNGPHDGSLHLQPAQLAGFCYAMQNTIDRIKEAETLIDAVRTQPEALPA
jgi:hypothetical protein